MSTDPPRDPRVRAVVVNHNGGALLERCLAHLCATEWPADALEIVVVDNASTDGSAEVAEARFPQVQVMRSAVNRGFAGGANLALSDLEGADHVALLNNDAFVEPGWLGALVDALRADQSLGAACPKILFEPRFCALDLATEPFNPGGADRRVLGSRVTGLRVGSVDVFGPSIFASGFSWPERDALDRPFRWSEPRATLWVALPDGVSPPWRAEVALAAEREKEVTLSSGSWRGTASVGAEPRWLGAELAGPAFDVINNAGNELVEGGYGRDRGYHEADERQYDEPAEVFSGTGAAVLLRSEYLADVGLFDERFFLYYEDLDLAWRGRLRGWRYRYVPEAVVRHAHSATAVELSPLWEHHVQRNRLLTLAKNAPAGLAWRQAAAYAAEVARIARGEVLEPLRRGRRPRPVHTRRRLRAGLSFLRLLPHALRHRARLGTGATVDRGALLEWMVPG